MGVVRVGERKASDKVMIGEVGERRGLHRLGNAHRQAGAVHQPVAEAAEDQRADAFGPGERQETFATSL